MLELRKGVSIAETDYGMVLLDEESGQYWNLNPSGAITLRTLLAGGTTAQVVRELTGEYAVDAETASRDVEDLLEELGAAGLVQGQVAP